MLNNKIRCYETMVASSSGADPLAYFECFERVEQVLENNYLKLVRDS